MITERWRGDPAGDGLPPGELEPLDTLEKADRTALVQRADRLGPVFRGLIRDEPTVCIVGLARCRRFLKDHADSLEVETLDLKGLFPAGFLRSMHGEVHLDYRRWLVRAVRTADGDVSIAEFEGLASNELQRHASEGRGGPPLPRDVDSDAVGHRHRGPRTRLLRRARRHGVACLTGRRLS